MCLIRLNCQPTMLLLKKISKIDFTQIGKNILAPKFPAVRNLVGQLLIAKRGNDKTNFEISSAFQCRETHCVSTNEQTDPNRLQAVPLPLCTPSRLIFAQTFQISSPIAVGVLVRSGINLIDDSVLPPLEILLRFGHANSCHGRTDDDQTGDE